MHINMAIDEAIQALREQADDTYEGDELDDPQIQAWIKSKDDAVEVLKTLKV